MNGQHPIRAILERRGSTVRWLAGKLGMHETLLNHYLARRRPVPVDFYDRVADVLDVPPDLLKPTIEKLMDAAKLGQREGAA